MAGSTAAVYLAMALSLGVPRSPFGNRGPISDFQRSFETIQHVHKGQPT